MVTTDTRSNNEEITTREGFELPEMPRYMRMWNPITLSQVYDYAQQCYQAAKADELAFLESLMVGDGDDYPYNAIERRIAALKGESRG